MSLVMIFEYEENRFQCAISCILYYAFVLFYVFFIYILFLLTYGSSRLSNLFH